MTRVIRKYLFFLLQRYLRNVFVIFTLMSLLLVISSITVYLHRTGLYILGWQNKPISIINNEIGYAYTSPLGQVWMSSHEKPTPAKFLEDSVALGPGNALHDDIRKIGKGYYSFWHDTVYFSTSDNSNPHTNGKKYEVLWPRPIRASIAKLLYFFTFFTLIFSALFVIMYRRISSRVRILSDYPNFQKKLKDVQLITNEFTGRSHDERIKLEENNDISNPPKKYISSSIVNILLLIFSVLFTLLIVVIIFQLFYKTNQNLESPVIPGTWSEELGWIYEPNKEFEYWVWSGGEKAFLTTQQSNEWGFTDQPIPKNMPSNGLRIMILGDSFAEALQVEMDEKLGYLLENSLHEKLGVPVEVVTLGRSGTGQVNQYAYWRKYVSYIDPHILVLLFIRNDMRDNHSDLSARYNNWNPLHPPRLYFMLSSQGEDGLIEIPIDADWQNYWSVMNNQQQSTGPMGFLGKYKIIKYIIQKLGSDTMKYPWNITYQGYYVDDVFFVKEMSNDPIIKSGWLVTERIVNKFSRECSMRGTKLVLMNGDPGYAVYGDKDYSIFDRWISEQALRLNDTFVSFPTEMVKKNLKIEDVTCVDGHWNKEGHKVAKGILEKHILELVNTGLILKDKSNRVDE